VKSRSLILAVETSCDETSIALVEDGRWIHSNVIASQVAMHAAAGGIVPEIAARAHLRWIVPVLDEAWAASGASWSDVSAVAVTQGPGLAGSLLVGINFAKTLAYVHSKPLVPVNHLEGHLYAAWLDDEARDVAEPIFPLVALIVSGGHTFLVEMRDHLQYRLLGETVDDAAGEAFDKVGRLLGLPYPGGPEIMRAAAGATGRNVTFPRAWLGDTFDFSFSGLKTAARRTIAAETGEGNGHAAEPLSDGRVAELAFGFQESVVDVLVTKTLRAARTVGARCVVLGGGVAANRVLRDRLADLRGSTSMYETLGNTDATAVVSQSVALLARIVSHHKGRVVKTLGDGLMATLHAEQFDFHSFQTQVIAKQAAMRCMFNPGLDLVAVHRWALLALVQFGANHRARTAAKQANPCGNSCRTPCRNRLQRWLP